MAENRRGRVRYSDEFRRGILDKLATGKVSLRQVSREARVSLPTLIKWRKEAAPSNRPLPTLPASQAGKSEIERLQNEIAQLREERDRLRHGIAILVGVKVPD